MLAACISGSPGFTPNQGNSLEDYLQTADGLTDRQRHSLSNRRPFVGMTEKEAGLALRRDDIRTRLFLDTLQAVYTGGGGIRYLLEFDGGRPNRVIAWRVYREDRALDELPGFRDVHPNPVIPVP